MMKRMTTAMMNMNMNMMTMTMKTTATPIQTGEDDLVVPDRLHGEPEDRVGREVEQRRRERPVRHQPAQGFVVLRQGVEREVALEPERPGQGERHGQRRDRPQPEPARSAPLGAAGRAAAGPAFHGWSKLLLPGRGRDTRAGRG